MTGTQTTFTPVSKISDTLLETYLKYEDVKSGDKVKIVKVTDKPIMWVEDVTFKTKEGEEKKSKVYKCMVQFGHFKVEMSLNNMSRKTIYNKVKDDLEKLENMNGILATIEKGVFSSFFIAVLE